MAALELREIDWTRIRKSLEDLLRYEREAGRYEDATIGLLSTLVHSRSGSAWRIFLLEGENFAAVVRQVVAISDGDGEAPQAALDSIRELVVAYAQPRRTDPSFLGAYLKQRPAFPGPVRGRLDQLVLDGKRMIPLRAAALASELERLNVNPTRNGAAQEVFSHWYEEIMHGRVTASKARYISRQLLHARDRLLDHLREVDDEDHIDETTVYERYSRLFKSQDMAALADLVIAADRLELELQVEQIDQLLANLSKDEVMRRFKRLREWMDKVNLWKNHFGVILTPMLTSHLSRRSDFEPLLGELDRLREETRNGRFRIDNPLQKELEYKRFVSACTSSFIHPRTFPRQPLLDPAPDPADMPRLFKELQELPPPTEEEYSPSERDLLEAKRTAYEAAVFLEMLKEFRARTSRDIVVVGNERYGRQWVVEPIEEYLKDGFTIRYHLVNSGASMSLTVPSPFPREFVREISERIPHIVVADGCGWPFEKPYGREIVRRHNVMRSSRALRGYANWFVVFNDIRARGDVSSYEDEFCLPANHISEVRKWYQFAGLRQELGEWVVPGPTYRVAMWAPLLENHAVFGDVELDPEHVEIAGDRPLAVLANTNIYRDEGEDLPSALRGTTPAYFDEPNAHVRESVVFGFGSHGFETRVRGPTTASFVAVMQRHIKREIAKLLASPTQLRPAL